MGLISGTWRGGNLLANDGGPGPKKPPNPNRGGNGLGRGGRGKGSGGGGASDPFNESVIVMSNFNVWRTTDSTFTNLAGANNNANHHISLNSSGTLQTTTTKYGAGCYEHLDGNNNNMTCYQKQNFTYGPSNLDLTVEAWVYLPSLVLGKVGGQSKDASNSWTLEVDTNKSFRAIWRSGGTNNTLSAAGTLQTGRWYHVAYVLKNDGGTWGAGQGHYLFVDGVLADSNSGSWGTTEYATTTPIKVGNNSSFGNWYIDDFRMTAAARYTENFTPPEELVYP